MKPYILDLREERCPMALLKAKREIRDRIESVFVILIRDTSSMSDIVRFFKKQGFIIQIEELRMHYQITINKSEPN